MVMIVRVVILCFPTKTKNMLLQGVYLLNLNLTKGWAGRKTKLHIWHKLIKGRPKIVYMIQTIRGLRPPMGFLL